MSYGKAIKPNKNWDNEKFTDHFDIKKEPKQPAPTDIRKKIFDKYFQTKK